MPQHKADLPVVMTRVVQFPWNGASKRKRKKRKRIRDKTDTPTQPPTPTNIPNKLKEARQRLCDTMQEMCVNLTEMKWMATQLVEERFLDLIIAVQQNIPLPADLKDDLGSLFAANQFHMNVFHFICFLFIS